MTASRLWPRSPGVSARERRTVQSARRAEAPAEPPKLVPQESVVESRVVRDEQLPARRDWIASATTSKGGASATIASLMPVNC